MKTRPTERDVREYLQGVEHPVRRADCLALLPVFEELSGERAVMWGDSIVGFGKYDYKRSDGKTYSWLQTGFAPRRQNLSLYLMMGCSLYEDLLADLGRHKTARSCLYINKLADIDMAVLRRIITRSLADLRRHYRCG